MVFSAGGGGNMKLHRCW